MYGGKNTLIRASVDRREACSPDVILSKIPTAEKEIMPKSEQPKRIILTENG